MQLLRSLVLHLRCNLLLLLLPEGTIRGKMVAIRSGLVIHLDFVVAHCLAVNFLR